jgi:hypothetical protein
MNPMISPNAAGQLPAKMLVLLTPRDQHLRANPEDFFESSDPPPAKCWYL